MILELRVKNTRVFLERLSIIKYFFGQKIYISFHTEFEKSHNPLKIPKTIREIERDREVSSICSFVLLFRDYVTFEYMCIFCPKMHLILGDFLGQTTLNP